MATKKVARKSAKSKAEEVSVVIERGTDSSSHPHTAIGVGVTVTEKDKERVLHAPHGCRVIHDEHNTIKVPPGDYVLLKIQEYDHAKEERRAVMD